jgi:hypothetical protein
VASRHALAHGKTRDIDARRDRIDRNNDVVVSRKANGAW